MNPTTLTTGSVFGNVIRFSLPYLLSYFLQTLYGMADLFIIGQFDGVASTTAVSIGSQVMHMLTVMIVGLAMGTTVSIARFVGAGNQKQVSISVGNTATLFMAVSIIITVLLLLLLHPIISAMSTPEQALDDTVRYLTICFIAIPFITAYNIISSIFRGMGDSKSYVLHRHRMYHKHRLGLSFYRSISSRPHRRGARRHAGSDRGSYGVIFRHDEEKKDFSSEEGF